MLNIIKSTLINNSALPVRIFSQASVNTAIGILPANMSGFVSEIVRISVGIGGAAAIGLLSYGGFTILTSAGDPEKLNEGKEMMTNALMGLALIILSVVVLQWLGWDILGLGSLGISWSQVGN